MANEIKCACPSRDARTCIRIRYPQPFSTVDECEELDPPCECPCHDHDYDDEDTFGP